ncbi:hypothetical protein [Ruania zhangjianzhongii]|uniref:hypothetical protein n=1 Tax=Ruania zhangjianzhongii TaxID=2603206 RepID=UPI0011CAC009|nr:hypothetical protein [Ruania zhangjianzhongii]
MRTRQAPELPTPESHRTAARPSTGPPAWFTTLTAAWLVGYAVVRLVLMAIDVSVPLSAIGTDLIVLADPAAAGTLAVGLLTVGAQAGLQRRAATSRLRLLVTIIGGCAAAALMAASALVILDLIGGLLPGLGLPFFAWGALSRLGCAIAAVLIGTHTWLFWRATGTFRGARPQVQQTPGWAIAAGYVTVAACLTRLVAQLIVGMEMNPLADGPALVVFEAGFLLAGVLLPLALVHRWGRVLPGWIPWLGDHRVPRPLLLICGAVLGVTMVAYFGMMTVMMVLDRLAGRNPFPPSPGMDLPEAFFWVSVPAYLVWGIGLVITTLSYARVTARRRERTAA